MFFATLNSKLLDTVHAAGVTDASIKAWLLADPRGLVDGGGSYVYGTLLAVVAEVA